MTYIANIPLPGDLLSKSQQDINNNFTKANSSFGRNHYPFDDGTANNGKHKFVDMPVQLLPAISAGEGALYVKTAGQSQLYYTPDAGGIEYQVTRVIDASFARFATDGAYPSNATPAGATTVGGWTFLPGGLLLQYGTVTTPGNASTVIDFPISFTNPPFAISISIQRNSGSDDNLFINAKTASTFTYFASTSGTGFQAFDFIAIGI